MGIASRTIEPHWNYLLAFDADLVELSRYVEFHENNFNCFSIEIARILLASAAEVDVVSKLLCKTINPKSRAGNIHRYRDTIRPAFPGIASFEVFMPRFGLSLHPWNEWTKKEGVPFWWSDYNKVKHQRDAYFGRASLKNMLNAVAGLFVMVLHLYGERARLGALEPPPQVLHVTRGHYIGTVAGGGGHAYKIEEPRRSKRG
jgi:hypothetical protein